MKFYGWVIEFGNPNDLSVAFYPATRHDRAYVELQAARLHGVIVELFMESQHG